MLGQEFDALVLDKESTIEMLLLEVEGFPRW